MASRISKSSKSVMVSVHLIATALLLCTAGNGWGFGCCYCRGPEDGTPQEQPACVPRDRLSSTQV